MEKQFKPALLVFMMMFLVACNPGRPIASPEDPLVSPVDRELINATPEADSSIRITDETNTPKINLLDDSNLQDQTETAAVQEETLGINTITPAFDNYPTGVPGAVVVTPSPEAQEMIALAVDLLVHKFNASVDEIDLFSILSIEWSDSSLGCPQPGVGYQDVITPGYQISLEWERAVYIFHTDTVDRVLLCHVQPPHEIYSEP
jgi:hypothetical protein